VFLLVMVGDQ